MCGQLTTNVGVDFVLKAALKKLEPMKTGIRVELLRVIIPFKSLMIQVTFDVTTSILLASERMVKKFSSSSTISSPNMEIEIQPLVTLLLNVTFILVIK